MRSKTNSRSSRITPVVVVAGGEHDDEDARAGRILLAVVARQLVEEGYCACHEEALAILETLHGNDDDRDGQPLLLSAADESTTRLARYFGWTDAALVDEFRRSLARAVQSPNNHNSVNNHDNVEVGESDDESSKSQEKRVLDSSREDDDEEQDEEEECLGPGECVLCERYMKLTRHHLIPKATWTRLESKSRLKNLEQSFAHLNIAIADNDAAKTVRQTFRAQVIDICRPCHSHIHKTYDHWTLATCYNTLDRLVYDPAIARFAKWASQQRAAAVSNGGKGPMVRSKRRLKKLK
jgi:hypothetical protein